MSESRVLQMNWFARSALQAAWERVRRNRGCAGVDGETIERFEQQVDRNLEQIEQALAENTYRPMPLRQLFVPKKDGSQRMLGVPTVRDRIVQQALLNVLHPILEPQFEACSFAYRPGRSHKTAVQQIGYWRDRGYRWVLDADIVRYFDNIDRARLFAEFAERVQPADLIPAQTLFGLRSRVFNLIEAWISAGILTNQGLVFPEKGIPQGAVVSPILANVYLDDFDEMLLASGLKLVRYADDFVVLAKRQPQIDRAQQDIAAWLGEMKLQLHPDKTTITDFDRGFRFLGHVFVKSLTVPVSKSPSNPPPASLPPLRDRLVHVDPMPEPTQMQRAMVAMLRSTHQPIPPPLFVVLGYQVRQSKPVKIESREGEWNPAMSTLYLVQQGTTLRKKQGRFVIADGETATEIPIAQVRRVLVFGQVQLTSGAIATCLEAQIPVVFLSQLGDYQGHLWSAERVDLSIEARQFQRWQELPFQLAIAQQIVRGKLLNSKQLLLRLNRKRRIAAVAEAIARIDRSIESVQTVENVESLRGYEGAAAAAYFPALGQLLTNPGFSLTTRTRRPPTDPVNSLLSFGYTLLFNNVLSLILAEGLNPHLGNLHRSDRHAPHLAFDLMEEFRSVIVDSLVITLVNQQILKPTDFSWFTSEGGVYLDQTARRVFLKHFEDRISQEISHPAVQSKVSYRRSIQLQVQHYKRCLQESIAYEPFLRAT